MISEAYMRQKTLSWFNGVMAWRLLDSGVITWTIDELLIEGTNIIDIWSLNYKFCLYEIKSFSKRRLENGYLVPNFVMKCERWLTEHTWQIDISRWATLISDIMIILLI